MLELTHSAAVPDTPDPMIATLIVELGIVFVVNDSVNRMADADVVIKQARCLCLVSAPHNNTSLIN
jgi:metal-sulfur cluster biosynthetic enzyme